MSDDGFHNSSCGQNPDRVYALALCRGDIQLDACRSCIQNASVELVTNLCPNSKQAVEWVEGVCMLRYSNEYFFGSVDVGRYVFDRDRNNVTNPLKFNENLRLFLDDLFPRSASEGSVMKVCAESRKAPDFVTIFALLQCTPDLSQQDCKSCLMACAHLIPECCQNSVRTRISMPSCSLQYRVYPFYNITRIQEVQRMYSKRTDEVLPSPAPAPVVPSKAHFPLGNMHNSATQTAVFIVVPIISGLILVACLCILLTKRSKIRARLGDSSSCAETSTTDSIQYDFNKIREATNNFSMTNALGKGGFGIVYKGKLQNGQEIAVKLLLKGSTQGDLEFQNEVMLLAKLQHRNLVRLVGFAQERNERVLVYEFIQNASLDHFIFDPTKAHCIDWHRRLKIIKGIAKGLLYLHEDSRLRIIHRDLKPSNILLDANMNPKIADFGTARLCEQDQSEVINTSKVAGTLGYMAPEYALHGELSTKSDVYSFGVIVLEIISGRKNSYFNSKDQKNLINFAWRNWLEGTITNVLDPALQPMSICFHEIVRYLHVALLCIQENAVDRPTMASIVVMLSSSTVTLPLPSKSSFTEHHNLDRSRNVESLKLPNDALPDPFSRNGDSITLLSPR